MDSKPVLAGQPKPALPAKRRRSLKRVLCWTVAVAWVLATVIPALLFGSHVRRLPASLLLACFLAAALKALDAGKA